MKNKVITIVFILAISFLIFKEKIVEYSKLLGVLIPKFEGFSPKPYWDYQQYSWGYGTKVPDKYMKNGKPLGWGTENVITINKVDAFADAMLHIEASKSYLQKLIKVSLTGNQWAALLSFAYNLGDGNADNLVPNINSKNWAALKTQWNQYINAGGKPNQNLIERRAEEWRIFSQDLN